MPLPPVNPRLSLSLAHSSSPAKDLPYFFWKSSPVYLCSGSFSLPEQTSSTEHPAPLRKARIPPSGPAQWLLLQSLGFPPLLWQPSLCDSAAHSRARLLSGSVSAFAEWGFQGSALSDAVNITQDIPCEGPSQSGPSGGAGAPFIPPKRAMLLHTWSSVKMNSSESSLALYDHKQNLLEAFVSLTNGFCVGGRAGGPPGGHPACTAFTVWEAGAFSGVGGMGQRALGDRTQP